ncbi:MAG TPA: glycosyltransferase family 39 protein [Halanaerobiales bacterium]|nr:glycosyltransferase family 39 protein [Halanaerobiales bacterium]
MIKLKNLNKLYVILIIYFLANLLFLTSFPFVHSDEAWLAGLSRTILKEGTYDVTEPFFDLYPRSPHAIRVIFHSIQVGFLKIFGYEIFTFRLISLIFGTISLFFFYRITFILTKSKKLSYLTTILLAVDIQFIYTSHLARQEIILVSIFLMALYYFLTKVIQDKYYSSNFLLGLIISISIGIHPNSFITFIPFLFLYLYYIIFTEKLNYMDLLVFLTTVFIGALIFILMSLYFDPNFIYNYKSYGETLGVFKSLQIKLDRLDYFYKKLYYQVSGTYFTPDIKPQFYLFGLTIVYSIYKLFTKKDNFINILLLSFIGINLGYIMIGRYNQISIIFIFPILYFLLANLIKNIDPDYSKTILTALIFILLLNSFIIIYNNSYFNYKDYLNDISTTINKEEKVLANLNTQFYFDYNKLYDYRNLAYLDENNLSFSEYIEKNNIKYIIYPEEMDFIYNRRPTWNTLYGNLYPYYSDMKDYLVTDCRLAKEFSNKTYGMRIAKYIGTKDWKVKIYKVIDN